ncbi:MAG TPA: threonine--tRNA ligase [Clostridia bacterium]|nr:threonine--tRNA ligase [Clostridia bacterium]
MKPYKDLLAEELTNALKALYPQCEMADCGETGEGFFCDYDILPLTPETFEALAKRVAASKTGCVFRLASFSGAYEDGNAKKRMLQRIYVTAFETEWELEDYDAFMKEASARDHKTLGAQLDLFSSDPEIGQGLILWHPKGAMLRYALESFGQQAHILNGYDWVCSPHIGKAGLWKTSGHLDFYRDSMYRPIVIDDEEYYLKPMNCPFHIAIYNGAIHSYRELPVKYAEYGTVYRYELSGALNGLTRVRGFTQDDAHIICTPEQVEKEVSDALKFSLYILRSFGLAQFEPYISTKPKTKSIGGDCDWEMATDVLKKAVESAGLAYEIDEGGGAFYGPKIDLKLRDALNRQWQCSTIQFDFNLPERFRMFYVGSDGQKHTPYMVHRALFGSLERFIALLIEHYKGDFPFWFAPVQFGIVPVRESNNAYATHLSRALRSWGFRASANCNEENMRGKIKKYRLEKVPYLLVVGDAEAKENTFSVRGRQEGELGKMDIAALCEYLKPQIELGVPRCILDDE